MAVQLWEKVLHHALSNENLKWAFRRKNFCLKQKTGKFQ
ncbi:TPA: hypothetical protein K8250_003449 [Escherichia coli]|nr:hypothetical protein [Escherichia coli]EFH3112460.1 hypothetical protein [Escherichia coli]EFH3137228.1 hypothetical protein [Escherichia coli]EFH7314691.1 hypothetical protein [Escherichia coli]EFI5731636.1 hypothetical protein [Escherichia coli]